MVKYRVPPGKEKKKKGKKVNQNKNKTGSKIPRPFTVILVFHHSSGPRTYTTCVKRRKKTNKTQRITEKPKTRQKPTTSSQTLLTKLPWAVTGCAASPGTTRPGRSPGRPDPPRARSGGAGEEAARAPLGRAPTASRLLAARLGTRRGRVEARPSAARRRLGGQRTAGARQSLKQHDQSTSSLRGLAAWGARPRRRDCPARPSDPRAGSPGPADAPPSATAALRAPRAYLTTGK